MNPERDDTFKTLIEEVQAHDGIVREGCSTAAREAAVSKLAEKFKLSLPQGYMELLRRSNGLVWEDLVICYVQDPQANDPHLHEISVTSELISVNEHYRRLKLPSKYVVLGYDDTALLAFESAADVFVLLDTYGYDVLARFDTFAELFEEAVEGPV